ncbi:hypothetical protein FGO68_gene17688 [Halteria grandinella]|uniref:Uncharacterized protein n=1 Tax=Halteria grandinella TaxID=5974 RepID=A0A8J8T9N6_HALGN|nr:hypothetical protein FGO68_gene17688 [Halteria grandinella]
MNIVLQFIYLDILQTDKWLIPFFQKDRDDDGNLIEDEPLSEYFEQSGFQSMLMFKNLGSTLIFSLILINLYVFYMLSSGLGFIHTAFSKVAEKLESKLFWNSGTRFLIQQFQPLLVTSLINLYSLKFNTVVAFASTACSFVTIIVLTVGIIKMAETLKATPIDQIQRKSAPIVEGINTKTAIGRYWMPITLVKWAILSVTLVTLRNYPVMQLSIVSFLSFTSQILLIKGKPFSTSLENNMSLFNELMASLYLYGLFTLTDSMGRNLVKEECGVIMLMLVVYTIIANILKVLYQLSSLINFKRLFSPTNKKSTVPIKPLNNTPNNMSNTSMVTQSEIFEVGSRVEKKAVASMETRKVELAQRWADFKY